MKKAVLAVFTLLFLSPAVAAPVPATDLHPFVRGSWQVLRKIHAGQAIVVHFWGLTCGPCLTELPAWTAELKKRHDLNLVLVDASPFGDDAAGVRAALTKAGLIKQENWLFADSFEERLRFEIDPHWHGEMPYTMLIGRDGKVTPITGLMNFAQLDAWLDGRSKKAS